ncbi:hypothetical protein SAMN05660443_0685 [Marinospirillum celere]|uniref:Uncharacterized protein n=1 Tax=Marinospirillum celere TaxID=1122252 RepID=A0A1I1ESK4_9GAMM|nr:hypothetical protein [Marinospirillum celere]SFB87900.1 hypothetical protein SAMN05660443_0685 [Marinospirillum celere]
MTEGTPPNQPEKRSPANRRKRRWLLGLLIFFLFLPLLLAIITYWVLRSPLLHSQIWPRIQPIIAEETGFQVDLASLKLDLLGQVQVTGIAVRNLEPQADFCEDLELTLDEVDLQFRPWPLLSGELQVDLLAVRNLDVRGCLLVDLPPPVPPTEPPPSPEEQLAPILELLDEPPLAIHLHRLLLEGIKADLQIQIPAEQLKIAWQGQVDLDTQLQWTQNELKGQLQGQLLSLAPLQVDQQAEESLQLSVLPQIQANLGWQLERNSPWSLELNPLALDVQLQDLDLQLQSDDVQLTANWPEYQFKLEDAGHLSLMLDGDWPLTSELLLTSQLKTGHLSLQTPEIVLNTQLHQGLRLEALGHLDLLNPNLENLQLEMASQQGVKDLQLTAEGETLSLQSLLLTFQAGSYGEKLDTSANQGDFLLGVSLDLLELEAEPLLNPLNLHPQLQIQLSQDLSQARLTSNLNLDQLQLLDLDIEVFNRPEQLEMNQQLQLSIPLALKEYLAEAQELEVLGALALKLQGQTRWQHDQADLFQADLEALPWGQLHQDLQLTLSQESTPSGDLHLIQPLVTELEIFSDLDAEQHQVRLNLHSEILHPPLLQPLPFAFNLNVQADTALERLVTEGLINLDQNRLVNWQFNLDNLPRLAQLQGQLDVQLLPEWQQFIEEVAELKAFGPIHWQQGLDLQIAHPYARLEELDPERLDALDVTALLTSRLNQPEPPAGAEIRLLDALEVEQRLAWSTEAANLDVRLLLPGALLPEGMEVNGINLLLAVQSDSGLEPEQLNLQLKLDQQQLSLPDQLLLEALAFDLQLGLQLLGEQLTTEVALNTQADRLALLLTDQEPLEVAELLFPLVMLASTEVDLASEQVFVHSLLLTLGDAWLEQTLSAESDFSGERLLAEGQTQLRLRDNLFSAITGPMQGSGSLLIPWSISLVDLSQLSLNALAQFEQLSLSLPEASIEQLDGQISIQQELDLVDFERLRFSYLLEPDAFQRVDFNRVEPWLDGRQDFSLERLAAEDLALGPLEATFSIQQNLIRLQDFSLQALGGEVAGQFYLDVNPAGWRLGLLSRVSRLDLRELLPETLAATAYSPVNARTAFEFDFSQRLAEGRIDLTDINRTQLLQLLDIIDPDHRDPQLATARSGLRAAHPRWVRVEMQNGLMDLTLSLSLFRDPIRVRNLPLTPLIERFAEEALLLPELLPLESAP